MQGLRQLTEAGQKLWLDNITRDMLDDGTLARYIGDFNVSGLTSNPTIFHKAIEGSSSYDADIRLHAAQDLADEALFLELAVADLRRAADLFRPLFDASNGEDGWVSLEVSPLLVDDAAATIKAAMSLHEKAARPNLFIKIPGSTAGLDAIEESIFRGIPINVTLLFSSDQYEAAARAYMAGIERRLDADLDPRVRSVASLFVSRWDVAVQDRVPEDLRNRLGVAVAQQTYQAYRDVLQAPRWRVLAEAGALPQRLLWASTGTKDPQAPDTLYVEALAAPDTINTLPDKTLRAFADHGEVRRLLQGDGDGSADVLERYTRAGVDLPALAEELQTQGAQAFDKSWKALLACIASKRLSLAGSASGARQ